MQVKDIMTPRVIGVAPDVSILDALDLMVGAQVSGLPVIDAERRLIGILSEGDLLRRSEFGTQKKTSWFAWLFNPGNLAEAYSRSHARQVSDVMTANPYSVGEEATLEEAVELMERHRIKRLPVLRDGILVGIVSRGDFARALAKVLRAKAPETAQPSDTAIRAMFLEALRQEDWAPISRIDPVVENGVVQLHGSIADERQRSALRIAAEAIPGVRGVEDHLVWIDPYGNTAMLPPPEPQAQAPAF